MPVPRSFVRHPSLPLALGLVLRVWLILHAPRVSGDTVIYGAIARNWLEHGVYGWATVAGVLRPTLIRLPGYPIFLAMCFRVFGFDHYRSVMLVQAGVDLGGCLLLAGLAGRLFGERVGRVTLWLAALCPFTACYVAAPLAETLTLATIVVALDALDRWQRAGAGWNRWLIVLASALAYSLLLRPEQGLLAAAVLPGMWWMSGKRHSWRALQPVAVVGLLTLLPLVPWTLRNQRTFHIFQPLAPRQAVDPGEPTYPGFGHWFRTWGVDYISTEDVYWSYDGGPISLDALPDRAFDSAAQRAETAALLADYNVASNATPEIDERFDKLARERLNEHPLRRVTLPLARVVNMMLRPRTETLGTALDWWFVRDHPEASLFAAACAALNLGYFTLGAWGAVQWARSRTPKAVLWVMLGILALRAALLLTLDNSEPRYTLEFFPILFVLAALPFSDWLRSSPYQA